MSIRKHPQIVLTNNTLHCMKKLSILKTKQYPQASKSTILQEVMKELKTIF